MSKTTQGLSWSFADNITQQIINFIVGIILARILSPAEFGIVGIMSVFISVLTVFMDGGLNDAIINKQNVSDTEYSTVFWANIGFGLLVYLILFLTAPYIALFFNEKSLAFLLRIGGLTILLLAVSSIQRSIFTKEINFKYISLVSLVSVLMSGSVAIAMALAGFGVISLVIRIVLGQFITVVAFYLLSNWKPKKVFSFTSFKSLYKYGVNLFIARLLNTLQNNIFPFIIGKIYTPIQLGYYTRADAFKSLVSTNVSNTIQRVSFPVLSNIVNDKERIIMFNKFMTITGLLTSFLLSIVYFSSKPIVLILLGEKWINAIPVLQILTISGFFIPLYNLNLNFLAVIKKTKLYLLIEIISKMLLIPTVIIGLLTNMTIFLWIIVIYFFIIYTISFMAVRIKIQNEAKHQILLLLKISIPVLVFYVLHNVIGIKFENNLCELFCNVLLISVLFIGFVYLFYKDLLVLTLKKNNL